MDRKIITLIMLSLLVVPAVGMNPIDLILHPSYLIKLILKTIGLEQSTEDKLLDSPLATSVSPEYQQTIDLLNNMVDSVREDAIGLNSGERINEFVYVAFIENGVKYGEWSMLMQNGIITALETGKGNYGEPTIFIRMDYPAAKQISEMGMSLDVAEEIYNLYLDGHIELEPEDKVLDYAAKFTAL